ncbi:protein penguin [Drosophila ficusphila]|uniref:protein penguin n=1 Tax=Drosophila ficusphila TaxID=30025 RepID=UPI0007E83E56|nr:protein penguin [Drosophila ficusphila]
MVSSDPKGTGKVSKSITPLKANKSPGKPANGQKFKPKGAEGAGKFNKSAGGPGKQFDKPGAGGAKKFDKPGASGYKKFDKSGANGGKKFGGNKFAEGNKFRGKPQTQTPAEGEKQDWNKFKQEKKDLKLKRKSSKDTYEITKEAKQIYEKLRCRRTENKDKLVEQIYKVLNVGDTISKVVKAHDTARVLQCMLKYASPALRAEISEQLLPFIVEMCQSKYAQFCVQRMLKYGAPATKSKLVDSLYGHIVRLAGHSIASGLLDTMYQSATPQQRIHMRQEFYGDLYRKAKDVNVKSLSDTYKEATNMKASILGSVKANLDHVANKQLVDSSLVHAVMLEYLRACEDDQEKLEETVSTFSALVPHMLSTKEGSEAGTICFYKATPKNRRAIIKNIKEHLLKIATHEHGHVFLISLLNSLDDTKATKKAIYDNLHGDLKTLVGNQYGRRVIQWLVAPGDTTCFHPEFIRVVDEGLAFGKKEKELRRKEIFEQIEAPIAQAIAEEADFWLSNSHIGLVTADVLNHIQGESYEKATTALAKVIAQPEWRISADAAGPLPQDKKKPHNDVEAIIAEATKQRKKLLNADSSSDEEDDDDEEDASAEDGEKEEKGADEDDAEPKLKKAKKEPKKAKAKVEEPAAPLVSGIEEAGMHIVLKKILKNDGKREGTPFSQQLLQNLSTDVLKVWLSVNRACFVLVKLVEESPALLDTCKKAIVAEKSLSQTLVGQKTPGAKLLANKLNIGK